MLVPLLLGSKVLDGEEKVWYGPAVVSFQVQFPGDPRDGKRNDVKVRFLGEKGQREERPAYFDEDLGAWRAVLWSTQPGEYRATLVRNGKDALIEPEEGIISVREASPLGLLVTSPRPDRLLLDTGETWVGVGVALSPGATPDRIKEIATAGANWVGLPSSSPALADVAEANHLAYTLPMDADTRYATARWGRSVRLVQWQAATTIEDGWNRPTVATTTSWEALFRNAPGPFAVPDDAAAIGRIKALKRLLDVSDWAHWQSPQTWAGEEAEGVAESDRMIVWNRSGKALARVPLANGTYDLTTIDLAGGASTLTRVEVSAATVHLPTGEPRLYSLRRRLDSQ